MIIVRLSKQAERFIEKLPHITAIAKRNDGEIYAIFKRLIP